MSRALRRRSIDPRDETGVTLIEMLVATLMSVIVVGASCAMLISAVRDQPGLSRKAQNVTTARFQLERVVRELRNGVKLETTTPSEVTLVAWVRREACGGAPATGPTDQPIECQITYRCSGNSCTRTEGSTTTVAFSGIGSTNVFCFVPSEGTDPTECGKAPEGEEADSPTYVGINLQIPNPEGRGLMTISDGATLRSAAFSS
jgi:hypothetical protein